MFGTAVIGNVICGVAFFTAFLAPDWQVAVGLIMVGMFGGCLRMGASGSITAKFTEPTNRGKIYGQVSMWQSAGRMVGPLVAGHLADYDPIRMPWLFAGISCLLSAAALAVAKSYVPSKPELPKDSVAPRRTRRKTLADKSRRAAGFKAERSCVL